MTNVDIERVILTSQQKSFTEKPQFEIVNNKSRKSHARTEHSASDLEPK